LKDTRSHLTTIQRIRCKQTPAPFYYVVWHSDFGALLTE
jgi:hypothetical protein